jgi:hypothetical protein
MNSQNVNIFATSRAQGSRRTAPFDPLRSLGSPAANDPIESVCRHLFGECTIPAIGLRSGVGASDQAFCRCRDHVVNRRLHEVLPGPTRRVFQRLAEAIDDKVNFAFCRD